MEILDAQVEALDGDTVLHSAPIPTGAGLAEKERERIVVEALLLAMDAVGVDGAVWHGFRSIGETAVEAFPDRFRAIALILDPDEQDLELECEAAATNPGIVGIRLAPAWPLSGERIVRLRAGAYRAWFAMAERLDLAVSLFISGYLKDVPAIAEAHPDVRILIDHVGMSPVPAVPLRPDRLDALPDLLALARYENVAVKFTGVPALSFDRYPFADLWPACHRMLEAFGPERLMWGSDFRRVAPLHSYAATVDFLRCTDEVSDGDRELLFGKSLRRWLDWEQPTSRAPGAVSEAT